MKEQAFINSYKENSDAVFRFCLVKTSDREIAKDLTQETFTRALEYLASGKRVRHMSSFLFTIARNLVIDHYRKKANVSLDKMQEEGFDPPEEEEKTSAELNTSASQALSYMYKLQEPYREILHLYYVEGLPPREIARITNKKPGTISVQIHRGREKLKSLLNKEKKL